MAQTSSLNVCTPRDWRRREPRKRGDRSSRGGIRMAEGERERETPGTSRTRLPQAEAARDERHPPPPPQPSQGAPPGYAMMIQVPDDGPGIQPYFPSHRRFSQSAASRRRQASNGVRCHSEGGAPTGLSRCITAGAPTEESACWAQAVSSAASVRAARPFPKAILRSAPRFRA